MYCLFLQLFRNSVITVEFFNCYLNCVLFWPQAYYDCECVNAAAEPVAVTGRCEGDCQLLSMFLVIFALIIFVTFTTSMPALAATLRCVFASAVVMHRLPKARMLNSQVKRNAFKLMENHRFHIGARFSRRR